MTATEARSDRPALTDGELRAKRARRIIEVFEQAMEKKMSDKHRDTTIEWLERCLLAHETDTLLLALREYH